jgi:hypothetical protein
MRIQGPALLRIKGLPMIAVKTGLNLYMMGSINFNESDSIMIFKQQFIMPYGGVERKTK